MMNRAAVKSFFSCAHFLARQHIPHTTNFEKLVELVVLCGGADLKSFLDRTGGNAVYTSHIAVVEFMEALGTWFEEFLLKGLHQASCFSIMADECTDVATIEEMSVFCRWEEIFIRTPMSQKHLALAKLLASSPQLQLCTCLTTFFLRWLN